MNKFTTAISLLDKVLATKDAAEPKDGWCKPPFLIPDAWHEMGPFIARMSDKPVHPCNAAFDEFIKFIDNNFSVTTITDQLVEEWKKIYYMQVGTEQLLRKDPPIIYEDVWPLVALRVILCFHNMPICHRFCPEIKIFHERYAPLMNHFFT
jgi:hypothetical protein